MKINADVHHDGFERSYKIGVSLSLKNKVLKFYERFSQMNSLAYWLPLYHDTFKARGVSTSGHCEINGARIYTEKQNGTTITIISYPAFRFEMMNTCRT